MRAACLRRYVPERNAAHRHDSVVEGQLVFHGSSRKVGVVAGQIAKHVFRAAAIEAIPGLCPSIAIAAECVAVDALALLAAPTALARAMARALQAGTGKGIPRDDHGTSTRSVGYGGRSRNMYLM